GTVCVVGKIRDLILQLSKSSIYSTKPFYDWDIYLADPQVCGDG
ncbi:PTS fructose IIA subunit, partial [Klebsiella pneumoniae]|nr:PTS fructose IIA subunit [Klebsiella pneumoniae]